MHDWRLLTASPLRPKTILENCKAPVAEDKQSYWFILLVGLSLREHSVSAVRSTCEDIKGNKAVVFF